MSAAVSTGIILTNNIAVLCYDLVIFAVSFRKELKETPNVLYSFSGFNCSTAWVFFRKAPSGLLRKMSVSLGQDVFSGTSPGCCCEYVLSTSMLLNTE